MCRLTPYGAIIGNVYYMLDGQYVGVAEQNTVPGAILPALDHPEEKCRETRVETQKHDRHPISRGARRDQTVQQKGPAERSITEMRFLADRAHNVLDGARLLQKQRPDAGRPIERAARFHSNQEGGALVGPFHMFHLHQEALLLATTSHAAAALRFSNVFSVPTAAELQGDSQPTPASLYLTNSHQS